MLFFTQAVFSSTTIFNFFFFMLLVNFHLMTCTDVGKASGLRRSPPSSAVGGRHIVPLHRQRVPVRNEDGIVSFKSVYFGNIFLGAPRKQHFSVVFDTGSGHVIVPSRTCNSEACAIHKRYAPQLSATATEIDYDGTPVTPGAARDQITIAFGTGEVTGEFVEERVCLGVGPLGASVETEKEFEAVPAAIAAAASKRGTKIMKDPECIDMRVVMATEMSHDPFASFSFDGVVGLGLDGLALAPQFSFFGMMSQYGDVAEKKFGVFLADSDEDFSEIAFGGHNPSRVKSPISWAPLAMPELGHWQVQISAIRVDGVGLDFCSDGQCRAVVDTGTSLIAVPSGFIDQLQEQLTTGLNDPPPAADGSTDCRKADGRLWELDIAGGTLTLGPGDYARASVHVEDGDDEEAAATATATLSGKEGSGDRGEAGQAKCHPTLMPIDIAEPLGPKLFILGEPVLRKYYTIYDWGQKRIGFGLAAHLNEDYGIPKNQEAPPEAEKRRPLLTIV